jgi:hypothetical protein
VDDQHPTVPTWTPAEPPQVRRPRLGSGMAAAVMAAVLLFGGVGLFAARQLSATGAGAASPEAAATGLLAALDRKDLDRAAQYLDDEEGLLVSTYRDRLVAALAGRLTGATGGSLDDLDLTARDVRFRRVAGVGGDGVAVVELAAGTVGGRGPRGAKLELPVEELNRRLAEQTKGAVTAVRVVTVRAGDRWRVSLLATAAEHARAAARAGQPDWARLGGADPAAPGAASPEAAVRDLAAAVEGNAEAAVDHLTPAERRVLGAYRQSVPAGSMGHLGDPRRVGLTVERLTTRTEQVADGVARVHLTGGTLRPRPGSGGQAHAEPLDLGRLGAERGVEPYLVAIQRDGTWYPSLVFTAADWILTRTERERP